MRLTDGGNGNQNVQVYSAMMKPDLVGLDEKKKLGAMIAYTRAKKGLSQTALGLSIGVSQQQISKYEDGSNTPDALMLFSLSQSLEIGIYELLGVETEENMSCGCGPDECASSTVVEELIAWHRVRAAEGDSVGDKFFSAKHTDTARLLAELIEWREIHDD